MTTWRDPLPQDVRDAVADAIRREPTPSVRTIAAEFNVSKASVYRIAVDYDLADAWEDRRERTEAANATNAAAVAERRTRLQAALLDDVEHLRENFRAATVPVWAGSKEGIDTRDVEPGPREHSETARAIASLIGQSVALARLESDTAGAGAASGMLDQFEQSLREAREKRDTAAQQAATE